MEAQVREKIEAATRLKEKGNEAFKEAEYAASAREYGEAMQLLWSSAEDLGKRLSGGELSPEDAVRLSRVQVDLDTLRVSLLLNQALVALKTEDFAAVLVHCSQVLAFQPANVKALFRRGVAKARLGRLDEAKADLEKTVLLDPANFDARKELASLRPKPPAKGAMADVSSYLSQCFGFCAGQPQRKPLIELSRR